MKRVSLILFVLALASAAVTAQDRIQDTFFGVKLGSDYRSVCRSDCFRNEYSGSNRWALRDLMRYKRESVSVGSRHRLILQDIIGKRPGSTLPMRRCFIKSVFIFPIPTRDLLKSVIMNSGQGFRKGMAD